MHGSLVHQSERSAKLQAVCRQQGVDLNIMLQQQGNANILRAHLNRAVCLIIAVQEGRTCPSRARRGENVLYCRMRGQVALTVTLWRGATSRNASFSHHAEKLQGTRSCTWCLKRACQRGVKAKGKAPNRIMQADMFCNSFCILLVSAGGKRAEMNRTESPFFVFRCMYRFIASDALRWRVICLDLQIIRGRLRKAVTRYLGRTITSVFHISLHITRENVNWKSIYYAVIFWWYRRTETTALNCCFTKSSTLEG